MLRGPLIALVLLLSACDPQPESADPVLDSSPEDTSVPSSPVDTAVDTATQPTTCLDTGAPTPEDPPVCLPEPPDEDTDEPTPVVDTETGTWACTDSATDSGCCSVAGNASYVCYQGTMSGSTCDFTGATVLSTATYTCSDYQSNGPNYLADSGLACPDTGLACCACFWELDPQCNPCIVSE